ncbi:peptidase S8/S53 domain-containing protein [Podospora didyma]|uniref:Peptidase S8/S53 domain-containing protein n=1 Tax=Podospora didyma TaxID=330526 RepID=A0AAE0U0E6_9PEZI|nr:peptidase S8/S53 domain-containing protein [Podospora didyma]
MIGLRRLFLLVGIVIPALAAPVDKLAAEIVPNKYIITLKPGVSVSDIDTHLNWVRDVHARSLSRRDTVGIENLYSIRDFNAYAGTFDAATINEIRHSDQASSPSILNVSQVAAVEQDKVWRLLDEADYVSNLATQKEAPWGLGSISHKKPHFTDYVYNSNAGQGTFAYLVDTGVRTTHVEFEGRAVFGYNAYPSSDNNDNYGHGTHTAGTIGGKTYGVAKKATVVAIKVFDTGSSTTAIVMDGFNWAVKNITDSGRQDVSVISMSLGGPQSDAFNAAVKAAYNSGVLSVVAAGNDGVDAKDSSPASAPEAITVGAIDVDNTRPYWSNTGTIVDIFAPGVDVLSSWNENDTDSLLLDGTSMATPHVAGLVLYLKSVDKANAKAAAVAAKVKSLGTKGVVQSGGTGSPNLIAYNGNGA